MILRRLGNKQAIAFEIQKYFPEHKIYVEPFFGAGGMFFNKPKAKYNIVICLTLIKKHSTCTKERLNIYFMFRKILLYFCCYCLFIS